jgi:hypothetical protein
MADPMTDPDNTEAFLPIEEEFFRAGEAISAAVLAESRPVLETAPASESLWSRLFKRKPRHVIARRTRAATV